MLVAGKLLFAQFGHYLDMEFGTRIPVYCEAPVPNQPSPYAEPYLFKINLLLVWLYLHSRTEVRRHTTNHLFHTALEGAHHHNCNNNYHSLRVCGASRQAPARQPEDALLRELFPTAAYTTYRGNEWRTYRLGRGILSLRGHCCGVPWQPHSFLAQSAATRGTTDGMAITQCTICQLVMGRAASPMLYSRTQTAGATRSQFPFSTILTVEGLLAASRVRRTALG